MTIQEQRGFLEDLSKDVKNNRIKQVYFRVPIKNIDLLPLEEIVKFSEEHSLRFRYQEEMIIFVMYRKY